MKSLLFFLVVTILIYGYYVGTVLVITGISTTIFYSKTLGVATVIAGILLVVFRYWLRDYSFH